MFVFLRLAISTHCFSKNVGLLFLLLILGLVFSDCVIFLGNRTEVCYMRAFINYMLTLLLNAACFSSCLLDFAQLIQ